MIRELRTSFARLIKKTKTKLCNRSNSTNPTPETSFTRISSGHTSSKGEEHDTFDQLIPRNALRLNPVGSLTWQEEPVDHPELHGNVLLRRAVMDHKWPAIPSTFIARSRNTMGELQKLGASPYGEYAYRPTLLRVIAEEPIEEDLQAHEYVSAQGRSLESLSHTLAAYSNSPKSVRFPSKISRKPSHMDLREIARGCYPPRVDSLNPPGAPSRSLEGAFVECSFAVDATETGDVWMDLATAMRSERTDRQNHIPHPGELQRNPSRASLHQKAPDVWVEIAEAERRRPRSLTRQMRHLESPFGLPRDESHVPPREVFWYLQMVR